MKTPEIPGWSDEKKNYYNSLCKGEIWFSAKETKLELVLRQAKLAFNPNALAGWDVLDLGCGSAMSSMYDSGSKRQFEAWFPRVCSLYGASNVIGIDLFDQDPKDVDVYKHVTANILSLLTDFKLAELFQNDKFNLIHTSGVIGSDWPGYTFATSAGLSTTSYLFSVRPDWFINKVDQLVKNLKIQASKLLKPQGLLAIDDQLFQLDQSNSLIEIESLFK